MRFEHVPTDSAHGSTAAAALCGASGGLPGGSELFADELEVALGELRSDAQALATDPGHGPLQGSMVARLRGLVAKASAADDEELATGLLEAEALVQAAAVLGVLDEVELAAALSRCEQALERLRLEELTPSGPLAVEGKSEWRARSVLVVGAESLAAALELDAVRVPLAPDASRRRTERAFDVEHTDDAALGAELAPALAADVIVVDADLPGARELVQAVRDHTLTRKTPVVVVGTFRSSEQAAPLVALGVARVLPKPIAARALRRICRELAALDASGAALEPLGATTLDALGLRLAEELQRGLCDAADDGSRQRPLELGDGHEIFTALWGAVGRIREHVTAHSRGAVRFAAISPPSAVPRAPWLDEHDGRKQAERSSGRNEIRGAAAESSLAGLRIVVADDDLAVNWFLAGLLRQAGATVAEAMSGTRALELAYRTSPDLVLCDVLMPGMGGLALCRALKRDLLLADVPIVLLSWKDDLLQRARELGAEADGFLRKEASGPAVLRRVRELVHPRQRVASRMKAPGEVRGRVDGLTTHSLLRLAAAARPDSRLTLRDAHYLYEIELRAGQPVAAGRVAVDGREERGPSVLGAALGARGGRFGLADASDEVAVELEGTLSEQIGSVAARARAVQSLLCGPRLARAGRVRIDEAAYGAYLDATPEPARGLLRVLAAGTPPGDLVSNGRASATLLESVLADAALCGAVVAVRDRGGDDLLSAATARELDVLRGGAAEPLALLEAAPEIVDAPAASALTELPDDALQEGWAISPSAPEALVVDDTPAGRRTPLLATVVFDRASNHGGSARDSEPAPAPDERAEEPRKSGRSKKRRARVQATERDASDSPAPVVASTTTTVAAPAHGDAQLVPIDFDDPALPRLPRPSAYVRHDPPPPPPKPERSGRLAWSLMFGMVGIALAVGARFMHGRATSQEPAAAAVVDEASPPAAEPEVAAAGPEVTGPSAPAEPPATAVAPVDPAAELPVELPLGPKDNVAQGEGMIEVVAGKKDKIFVDGKLIGDGPSAHVTLQARPEPYEVRVKLRGEERVRYVSVREGKKMRVRVAPPWSR